MKLERPRQLRSKLRREGLSREERRAEIRAARAERARRAWVLRGLFVVAAIAGGFAVAQSSLITDYRSAALCTLLPIGALLLFHEPIGLAIRRFGRWWEPEYRRGSWRR